jgi:hypothetical protein
MSLLVFEPFYKYFSTRVPVSDVIQTLGNSEQWKMTGKEDNVGFLATGSGVQQFQLSLGGCFVLQCPRFFPELMLTKHTSNSRASPAVLHETRNPDPLDTARGTLALGVPESFPVRAYRRLYQGVSRSHVFRPEPGHDAEGKL